MVDGVHLSTIQSGDPVTPANDDPEYAEQEPVGPTEWDALTFTCADLEALKPPHRDWGPWYLNPANLTLELYLEDRNPAVGNYDYYIDLERCLTSAQTLDWIFQVAGKEIYERHDVLGGLILAVDDILQPQGNLCGSGIDRPLRKTEVRALAEGAAKERPDRVAPHAALDGAT